MILKHKSICSRVVKLMNASFVQMCLLIFPLPLLPASSCVFSAGYPAEVSGWLRGMCCWARQQLPGKVQQVLFLLLVRVSIYLPYIPTKQNEIYTMITLEMSIPLTNLIKIGQQVTKLLGRMMERQRDTQVMVKWTVYLHCLIQKNPRTLKITTF